MQLQKTISGRSTASIGLEQRISATLWSIGPNTFLGRNDPRHSVFRRPASEIPLLAYWRHFREWDVRPCILEAIVDASAPGAVQRTGPVYTKANGANQVLEFPLAVTADRWHGLIESADRLSAHPFMAAVAAMAATILIHPFDDGNGRLSRAVFQGVLNRKDVLPAPVLPLGPMLHADLQGLAQGAVALSQTGDWDAYADLCAAASIATASIADEILGRPN